MPLVEEPLTKSIIGAFFEVYNHHDYGFFEAIYRDSLVKELVHRGHAVEREVPIDVYYKGDLIGVQRLDLVVDKRVVVEIKSTELLSKAAHRQLLSYLRGSRLHVGLLLHFGPKPEFHRVVHTRASPGRVDPL